MGVGVDAVKAEIAKSFGAVVIREDIDTDYGAKVLRFPAENRHFNVRISDEFDEDYGTFSRTVDLSELGTLLRRSKEGWAVITRNGISWRSDPRPHHKVG